ncbi:hypothetical protein BGX31_010576 [Mortierella sp. GBA43]|nr:hypothetical protein BGX31_010576 [Mortierella sp. GBA43]
MAQQQFLLVHANRANALLEDKRINPCTAAFTFSFGQESANTTASEYYDESVVWDHPLVVNGFDPSTHGFLHVTVAGNDEYGDVVIRFTSIPLDQVINTAGKSLKGNFDLYNVDGNVQGNISLTIAVFEDDDNQEVKGRSVIDSLYHQRLKQVIEASRQLRSGDIYIEGEQFEELSKNPSSKSTLFKKSDRNTVEWDEVIVFEDFNPIQHEKLYIEVFSRTGAVDKLVGFAAIPTNQISDLLKGTFKGKFDLFDFQGKVTATVSLTIGIVDSANATNLLSCEDVEDNGVSVAESDHQERIKILVNPIDNVLLVHGTSLQSLQIYAKEACSFDDREIFQINAEFSLSTQNSRLTDYSEYDGKKVEWGSVVVLDDYNPSSHRFLYVKVFGRDSKNDIVIRYTAIPLDQVVNSSDKCLKGIFDLYDEDWIQKGTISLTLRILDYSLPNERSETRGKSIADSEHKGHVKEFVEDNRLDFTGMSLQFVRIHVRHASALEDSKRALITYALFRLDINDDEEYKKTEFVEYSGNDVKWNEVVIIKNYDPSKHHTLYVEVMGEAQTYEKVIRYAAIPLDQVVSTPSKTFGGIFDLYDANGRPTGTISLTISAIGPHVSNERPDIKGASTIEGGHQELIKILYPLRDPFSQIFERPVAHVFATSARDTFFIKNDKDG